MGKISGHGGFLVKINESGPNQIVHNARFDIDVDGISDDVTDSSSAGWAEGLPILNKVNGVTIEVVDSDAASFALAVGITENAVVTLWCKRGAAATGDVVTNTIVRNVRTSNPQTGARRITITTEYGVLSRNTVAPDIP